MINNSFWKYFGLVSIFTLLIVIIFYQFQGFKHDILLTIIGFVFMMIASSAFYLASVKAIKSTNKMAFIQLVMFNVILKIVGFMAIAAIYYKIVHPVDKYFIIPFLVIYFIYTIFETGFIYNMALKTK